MAIRHPKKYWFHPTPTALFVVIKRLEYCSVRLHNNNLLSKIQVRTVALNTLSSLFFGNTQSYMFCVCLPHQHEACCVVFVYLCCMVIV